MQMIVKKVLVCGVLETNSYFYIDEKTKHGWLIDAGAEPEKLREFIKKEELTIEAILLTHGHFDHIGAVKSLSDELRIPYKIHTAGEDYLKNPNFNLSQCFNQELILPDAEYFSGGDVLSLAANPKIKLQVIHTPGHTTDSVVFYDEKNNLAFVGDTIFKNGIGNTMFPGGDEQTLLKSIKEKILCLKDETILYPGHMEQTTVGAERFHF